MAVQDSLSKKQDTISKITKQKELEAWFKWHSTCFASVKLDIKSMGDKS
jgi:hypothetical protein